MDVCAFDQKVILGVVAFFATSTVGLLVYIWQGGLKQLRELKDDVSLDLKDIKKSLEDQKNREAACREQLSVRFVGLSAYNVEIDKIIERQNRLRDETLNDYVRRTEHNIVLDRVNYLESLSNQLLTFTLAGGETVTWGVAAKSKRQEVSGAVDLGN